MAGFSSVDEPQAKYEADNIYTSWTFNDCRIDAGKKWNAILEKIAVIGANSYERELFYTALYRSLLVPHRINNSNGKYKGAHNESTVRTTTGDYNYYSGWSTWDDYRKYSLLSIIEPGKLKNIIKSIVEWYDTRTGYEAWGDGFWPGPTVRNEFMSAIILDAYIKGITDFDQEIAYNGMKEDFGNYPPSLSDNE